jgi:hypothetical protein
MQDSKNSNIWENAFMCYGIRTNNPTIQVMKDRMTTKVRIPCQNKKT